MKLPENVSSEEAEIASQAGAVLTKTKLYKPDINAPIEGAGGLSRREIEEMRKAGIKKPEFITWGDWLGPKRLSGRAMTLCYLSAMGWNNNRIASHTRMTASRVSIVLQSEIAQIQTQLIREVELQGLGVQGHMDRLAPQAARVAENILMSSTASPKEKWQVAREVLQQKLGKPRQTVEVTGSVVNDIYEFMTAEAVKKTLKELPPSLQDEALEVDFTEVPDEILDAEPAKQEPSQKEEALPVKDEIRSKLAEAGF